MIEGSLLRVLITRLSAVGDCIHSLPIATAIRARYPRAMIAWCCESGTAPLVKSHPAVNRMVVLKKGWLKSPTAIRQARRELRALKCDIVIDPQSLSKSAVAGWLSGARTRIGFAPPQGREVAPWLYTHRIERTATHVVDAYLELLQPLNITQSAVRFNLRPDDAAHSSIDRFIFHSNLHNGYAVINPGAGWESKIWPTERYALVAKHLGHSAGLKSAVVWAGEREKQMAEQIVANSDGHAVLAPKTSLLELACLVKAAHFFVGSDTGPMHLAAAFEVPCVAMFGPTHHEECGPYGVGHVSLQKQHHGDRGADNTAMQAIAVDEVCDACDSILARRARSQSTPRRAA